MTPLPRRVRPLAALCSALTVVALAGLVAGCGGNREKNITIKGSDTMVILGQKWADYYMKAHAGATVAVTGGGSGTGIAALINGTTDIAQSSRPMKDDERAKVQEVAGAAPEEIAVARDGVTVYVHESNPLAAISLEQLKGIYTGKLTNWKELGGADQPIVVYSRENNSGTYVFFKDHVLGGEDFVQSAQTLPGTAAVVNAVTKDPQGIGYGSGIKHVAILGADGVAVEPTEENIRSGAYALARPLYWYVRAGVSPATRALIDWVLSADGQSHVKEVGYFPVQ